MMAFPCWSCSNDTYYPHGAGSYSTIILPTYYSGSNWYEAEAEHTAVHHLNQGMSLEDYTMSYTNHSGTVFLVSNYKDLRIGRTAK